MQEHYYDEKNRKKIYSDGEGKPPIFVQAIIDNKQMSAIDFFHITDMYMNWDEEGDDELVLEPLVNFLARWGDDLIFAFDDRMAQLLYDIDTKAIATKAYKNEDISSDMFLYNRCVALINSKSFYNQICNGKRKLDKDVEFESILYVPARAWANLHGCRTDEYNHTTPVSYESFSNKNGWRS